MPLQFILNSEAMARIQRSGNEELAGMPVGQVVSRMNTIRSCSDVVLGMVEEYIETVEKMSAPLSRTTPA
jgi:hypothetical protein